MPDMPPSRSATAKQTAKQVRDAAKKAATLARKGAAAVPGSVLTFPVMRPVWLYLVVLGYVGCWWLTGLRVTAALIHVPVCVAFVLFAAGWVQHRTYLSRRSTRTGMLLGSGWLVAALAWPGIDVVAYGWVLMLVGSAAYRRHHDPGLPGEINPATDPEPASVVDEDMDTLARKWSTTVATKVVPGSCITPDGREKYADRYVLQLNPDNTDVTLANLPEKLGKVGHAMQIDPTRITVEPRPPEPGQEKDPTQAILRRVTRDVTAGRVYEGPVVENGRIVLGPYVDGYGDASIRMFDKNAGRAWSTLIIGETGSGKSRCEETAAIGAVCDPLVNPAIIVYIDPQEGASSQALWDHSAKSVSMNGAAELLMSVKTLSGYRQQKRKKLAAAGHKGMNGFWASPCTCKPTDADRLAAMKSGNHEPGCKYDPWIVLVIDEVHAVTNDPMCRAILASGAREDSKNGVAYIMVTQSANLEEGLKSSALRDNISAGNTIGMRTLATSIKRQLGLPLEPSTLPAPGGMIMQQKRPEDRPVPSMLVCPINPENTGESWADRWLAHYPTLKLPPDELAIVGDDWLMGQQIDDEPDIDGMTPEQIRDMIAQDVRERVLGERPQNGQRPATAATEQAGTVRDSSDPLSGTRDAMKQRVADVVRSTGGQVFRTVDVSATLDIAPQYAAQFLRELEAEGRIECVKKGHWQETERQDLVDIDPDELEDFDFSTLLEPSGRP